MGQFANQSEAIMTARAAMIALLTDPELPPDASGKPVPPAGEPSLSRRRFLALR
jgi:hypothetical protein